MLLPLFFAREDTKTPFRIAAFSMLVNAAVAIGLMQFFGYLSAALGATVSAWMMLLLLWTKSRTMGIAAVPDSRFLKVLPRIAGAAAAMGCMIWGLTQFAGDLTQEPGIRYLCVAGIILFGALAYAALLILLRAYRLLEFRQMLRQPSQTN